MDRRLTHTSEKSTKLAIWCTVSFTDVSGSRPYFLWRRRRNSAFNADAGRSAIGVVEKKKHQGDDVYYKRQDDLNAPLVISNGSRPILHEPRHL